MSLGFYQSQYNNALFLNKNGTYVAIYINNFQIIGSGLIVIENLKTSLSQRFKIRDLGPTSHYLNIKVNTSAGKIVITQKTYIEKAF